MILEWVLKSVVIILFGLTGFAYTTYYERRFLARIQVRIGPNRAGPWGLLQPVADGIKLIFKEELVPDNAYKLAFMLSPVITMVPAIVVMGVLPWGGTIEALNLDLSLANINVGILYILSVTSISVYGLVLAGWSSNNKYAMLGGLRSTAQMISYELSLGLAFLGPVIMAGSMNMFDIVKFQHAHPLTWAAVQFLGAVIFFIAMVAEINRAPFDMPEAEQELVAGYHTEYSGMKFALFFMGEYVKMVAVAAIFITLFWGGFAGPGVGINEISVFGWFTFDGDWLGPLYYFLKIFIVLGIMIWVRATLPRFRYDRLMAFGWKVLLPLALFNVFLVAVLTFYFFPAV
ncbi:MAG: NADH-quinone oxidoreductase subunit NuoH [Chloroflexota bacterium]